MGIILNPAHSNLMNALESEFNYEVEIESKIVKKKTFIKEAP